MLRSKGRRREGGCCISQNSKEVIFQLKIKILFDMIWYDMIWYDMIWYDMIWYDSAASKTRGELRLGRLFSLGQRLQEWAFVQPSQGVNSLQPPNEPFWDAAPASSNMSVKPCQRQSLGIVFSWIWILQGMSVDWITNFSVSMNNFNYPLSSGSSHLENVTGVSEDRHISLSTPFLQDILSTETWAAHPLGQSPWRG